MEMWLYIGCGLSLMAAVCALAALFAARSRRDELYQECDRLKDEMDRKERAMREEFRVLRQDMTEQRDNLYVNMRNQTASLNTTLSDAVQKLQDSNEKKLDQMRQTVDEKLDKTLSERLNVSFAAVSDQLQRVYRSLGEMKELSSGVSDLQRVLSNVKVRGTWAEVQLNMLLEQVLTSDQYSQQVNVKGTNRVDFAVKIPSREEEGAYVWLPIDSKFPQEDYVRIQEAAEKADKAAQDIAVSQLERSIKGEAKSIAELYIDVPNTTDFAIMYLPTEGLYAEVLRRPGLASELQQKYKVMIAGPTTLTAFLNTLQMGFRTIALDKRAAEVWRVLGAAKNQYEQFETVLQKARRKISEAGNVLDDASKRNRIIQRKLRDVESVPASDAEEILQLGGAACEEEDATPEEEKEQ